MLAATRLYVVSANPEEWARRYDLEPFSVRCRCGRERTTTLPFAAGVLRGLAAPDCECGTSELTYCVVHADGGDVLTFWRDAAQAKGSQ